jgi:hypothetical protein
MTNISILQIVPDCALTDAKLGLPYNYVRQWRLGKGEVMGRS